MPIGRSTHSEAQAREAAKEGHAILGFGPVYPTQTKERPDPITGLGALRTLNQELTIPLVAIGGIKFDAIAEIARTGTRYAAMISALAETDDPEQLTRELQRRFVEAS